MEKVVKKFVKVVLSEHIAIIDPCIKRKAHCMNENVYINTGCQTFLFISLIAKVFFFLFIEHKLLSCIG